MFPVQIHMLNTYIPTYYTDVLTRTFQSVLTILDIKWTHCYNTYTNNTSDYKDYIQHITQRVLMSVE